MKNKKQKFNGRSKGASGTKASKREHGNKSTGSNFSNGKGARGGRNTRDGKIEKKVVVGRVESSGKGFAFLNVDGVKDDPFIAGDLLNGAMHGDIVEAVFISYRKNGGEVEVKRIIERGAKKIVGTYFYNEFGGFIVPDDSRIAKKIYVEKGGNKDAQNLDKVVLAPDFTGFNRGFHTLTGDIVEILGPADKAGVDILSVIRSYNLYENFKGGVLKEADEVAINVGEKERKCRRDFRDELVVTIDGDDSKDFDDAVSLKVLASGNYLLGVHIADVAHYVKEDSKLDKEAFMRGTSVYFVDRVLPMLPEVLSNNMCSLNEAVERLTLSCLMEIDFSGGIVNYEIVEGVIESSARLTYTKVSKVLAKQELDGGDKDKYRPLLPKLKQMQTLANILNKKRQARGNIDFDLPESQIILDENKKAIDIVKRPRLVAHKIIEEFMLAANETVARFLNKLQAPGVFRVHESPPSDKLENLKDFLAALMVDFNFKEDKPTPAEFNELLQKVSGTKYELAVTRTALRTMAKAEYAPADLGHFGLASQNYCHFTSPIRRYPDLAVHRIVKEFLANGKDKLARFLPFSEKASSNSSTRERLAEKAEREVADIKKAEYMQDKIGNTYTGIISSVTDFGLFVELENTVEGLVRVENLPGHSYEFIERKMQLKNATNTYMIGDSLDIVVASAAGGKVEFSLVEKS